MIIGKPQCVVPQATSLGKIDPVLGIKRLGLAMLGLLAAGIDVRTRDLGLGGPASNPLEVLLMIFFLVLLADSVIWPSQPSALVRAAWQGNRWLTLYFVWAMFAGIVGIPKLALSFFVFRNLLPAFIVYVVLMQSMRSARDIRIAFLIFLVAALPNLLLGLIQRVRGGPFPVKMNAGSAVKMDVDGSFVLSAVSGLFNHPNGLSIFLMPVTLVAFGLLFSRLRWGWLLRSCLFLMLAASLALLYFTRAKGAWVWCAFGMAMIFMPRRVVAWRGAWVAQVGVVLVLIATITLVSLHVGSTSHTMMTRILLWKSTFYAAQSDLFVALLGSGQEAVLSMSAREADLQYANAHNVFLNQLVYFGLPAVVLYIASFVRGVRQAHVGLRESEDRELRTYACVAGSTLLAMAGQYFFEPAAEASGLAVSCFLFLAVAAVTARLARKT